jgi:hypothetical protein
VREELSNIRIDNRFRKCSMIGAVCLAAPTAAASVDNLNSGTRCLCGFRAPRICCRRSINGMPGHRHRHSRVCYSTAVTLSSHQ